MELMRLRKRQLDGSVLRNVVSEIDGVCAHAFPASPRSTDGSGGCVGVRNGQLEKATVVEPKRDAKWFRGRTRRQLHYGAASRGEKVPTLIVDDPPECFCDVLAAVSKADVGSGWGTTSFTIDFLDEGKYIAPSRICGAGTDFERSAWLFCLRGQARVLFDPRSRDGEEGQYDGLLIVLEEGSYVECCAEGELVMAVPKQDVASILLIVRSVRPEVVKVLAVSKERIALRAAAAPKQPLDRAPCVAVNVKNDSSGVPAVETAHVRAVYDAIADHWSLTRHKAWPKVADFLSSLPPTFMIADVGCGNGKYMRTRSSQGTIVGSDVSLPLLSVCRKAVHLSEVCAGDATRLPHRSGCFDAAICIAVLHHISTRPRRIAVICELTRIVRGGGRILIYAWAREQGEESRRDFPSADVLVPWHLADYVVDRRNQDKQELPQMGTYEKSVRVEEKKSTLLQRYCHVYEEGELEELIREARNLKVIHSYYDCSNWCVEAIKIA
jgi:ubiquinone/menaquinone biosynthesis C-methylase UbiE